MAQTPSIQIPTKEQSRMQEQIQQNEACLQELQHAVDSLKVRLNPILRETPECTRPARSEAPVACEFEGHMETVRGFIDRVRMEITDICSRAAV